MGEKLQDVWGHVDWLRGRKLKMGLSDKHNPQLRTLTLGAICKAVVESTTNPMRIR